MNEFYSCEELAERYKVKIITIYDWIKKGKLKAKKIGKQYLVSKDEVVRFENN